MRARGRCPIILTDRADSTSAQRWAALSGIAGALLFAVGNAIWGLDMPEDGTGVAEVVDFYADTADRIVIGGSLSLLSIAVFLVFGAALRQVLKDAGAEDFLATTAFAGLVLAMATGIAAESINLAAALRAQDDELSGDLAQSLFETSQMFGSAATGIGLGVFALATGAVALRTRAVLPRWLAIATAVMGVLLLSPLAHVNWVAGAALVLLSGLIGAALYAKPASARARA